MAMFRSPREVCSRNPREDKCERKEQRGAYCCDFCYDGWDSETEVDIHRNTTHRKEMLDLLKATNQHVCRICYKSYENKDDLIRHIKTWHLLSSEDAVRVEREIFICDYCSMLFFNKLLIQTHLLLYHMDVDKIETFTECAKCHRIYRLRTMWYHFQAHYIQSVAGCKICLTKCKNRKDVLKHLETHRKFLFCNVCRYETMHEEYFREHLATRHRKSVNSSRRNNFKWKPYFSPKTSDYINKFRFVCDTASKGVDLPLLEDTQLHICIFCREICFGEQSAKDHIWYVHHQALEPPLTSSHVCICGEKFAFKVLLKQHLFKEKCDRKQHNSIEEDTDEYLIVVMTEEDDPKTMVTAVSTETV
ncbi:unnamed protein product [Parnassius mnemosyne]|uniref:C2H2-type domain-containing protein n=1 Tax=Parnassius mnemosyne TaxID=213953 RepID=A0AAV1LCL6_9NEOP